MGNLSDLRRQEEEQRARTLGAAPKAATAAAASNASSVSAPIAVGTPAFIGSGAPRGASTSTAVGNLSEADAAGLHDRYSGNAALDAYRRSRSAETQTILNSAMQQAQGLNANENRAIRSNALSSINAQNQAGLRDLRGAQAASGIRGGLASMQMAQQHGAATQALAGAERNLVADNIKYKQSGLQNAASIIGNQENIERDMGADKLGTILAARAENAGLSAAQMQAQAAAAGGGGGGKK